MSRRRSLEIAPGFRLPIDAVTETYAYLATRGGGKTYAAGVFVEELLKAEQQVVILDPMPAWWGLRSSADGKSDGFPIAILGGDHGDVPLEETAGVVVADLIVTEHISAILDISGFSKSARRRFVTDFAERLYERNREAMHIVLEEADMFAPQNAKGDERMLGAIEDLVRRGRGRGIGTTLITQRSAVISKNVLDLTENLVVLRTLGTRSRQPIKEWIEDHGTTEDREAVMSSLQKLDAGEAWFYSPHFLGKLERIQYREKETFDSSATPKAGERRRKPKTVADVDLGALSAAMTETIERKKAEDPTELHKRIRSLEGDLESARRYVKDAEAALARQKPRVEMFEIPVMPEGIPAALNTARETIDRALGTMESEISEIARRTDESARQFREEAARAIPRDRAGIDGTVSGTDKGSKSAKPQVKAPILPAKSGTLEGPGPRGLPRDRAAMNGELTPTENKVLGALVFYRNTGPMTLSRLGSLTGLKPRGGSMGGALANLRRRGLLDGLEVTREGESAAPRMEFPPLGPELLEWWQDKLPSTNARVLGYVVDERRPLTTAEIADALGINARGGSMGGALADLRARALIKGGSGQIVASEDFYV